MPIPPEGNPPPTADRLMKQAAAARLIGVSKQYVPVMIGRGELEAEMVDGVPFIVRASAERAKAERDARLAKQNDRAPAQTSAA